MTALLVLLASPYNLFLAIAVGVAFTLAWREGRTRTFAPLPWVTLLALAVTAGLVGSKLIFLDYRPIAPGEKTILGALLAGIATVVLLARGFRLGAWRVLDALTLPTLAAMAVGRIGCFLAGCCAGTASTLPWAVRSPRTGEHVHPVQLYEMGADLALIALLRRAAPRAVPRADGVRMLTGALGYAMVRVLAESVREGRTSYGGLNPVQWSLLALAVVVAMLLVRRLRAPVVTAPPERAGTPAFAAIIALVALGALAFGVGPWLQPMERLLVLGTAAIILGAVVLSVTPRRLVRLVRVAPFVLAPQFGAMLMMQEAPDLPPKRELLVSGLIRRGLYDQTVGREYGTDCDGSQSSWPTLAHRDTHVEEASVGVRERFASGSRLSVSVRYLAGRDLLQRVDSGPVDVTPAPRVDSRVFGGTIEYEGAQHVIAGSFLSGTLARDGARSGGPTMTLMTRQGDDRRWYTEYQLADRRYFSSTGDLSYIGLGYTAGRDRPRALVGVGEGAYLQLVVPVRRTEFDVRYRDLNTREDGSGGGQIWSVGVRQAITIKR